jgi:hypothetical protein
MTGDNLPVVDGRDVELPEINADYIPSLRGGIIIRGAREGEWVEGSSVSREAWR